MFRAMVTDDEGKRVPLVWFTWVYVPGMRGPLPREVDRRMVDVVRASTDDPALRWSREGVARGCASGLVGALGPLCAILVSPCLAWMLPDVKWRQYDGYFMFGGFALAAVILILFGRVLLMPARARRSAALAAVAAGCCGSCGYLLPAAAEPETTLHRCSECGAAWRRG